MLNLPQIVWGVLLSIVIATTSANGAGTALFSGTDNRNLSELTKPLVTKVQQQARTRIQLRLVNVTGAVVDVYAINQQTQAPDFIEKLNPGETSDFESWPGLVWVFGQNRQQFQQYQTQQPLFQELRVALPGQQQQPRFANQYQQEAQLPQQQQPQQPQQLPQQPQQQGQGQSGVRIPEVPQNYPQQGSQQTGNNTQPRNAGQEPAEPAGFWSSTLTPQFCAKARFGPGISSDTCSYFSYLQRANPAKLKAYLDSVASRQAPAGNTGNAPQQTAGQPRHTGVATPENYGQPQLDTLSAQSWGGIVRAGPSLDAQRLDSLSEREQIALLQDSGVSMNGYSWFQIRYRDNRVGYQWGGIICGVGQPIPGAFQICN